MINKLHLSNFRNFKSKSFEFSDKITVISGHNAAGKTNILESLFLLSTGKSFKARTEVEMIKYEEELAKISGVLPLSSPTAIPPANKLGAPSVVPPASGHPLKLEAFVTTGTNGWPKKRLLVNGVPKRMVDFAGNFKTVLFGPWDMDLVTGSPSLRRKFLDTVLSQVDREYRRSILSYEKGIRQRNRLLYRIREENVSRSQLVFWNQLLIKAGNYITQKREEFILFANSKDSEDNNSVKSIKGTEYKLEYDRSIISEGRLEQYRNEEIASATTLVGPHRDDFIFRVKEYKSVRVEDRELAAYGSRGEQRMGILWLKMAELDYIGGEARPTLLLDDIFSELDREHRGVVVRLMESQQTIMTTADDDFIESLKPSSILEL